MTIKNTRSEMMADADLVLRTRSGDTEAFRELWRRHRASGMAVARSVTPAVDPDALVQESFTRIHHAIIKGGGPNGSFRAYLFTSVRNTAAAWGRSRPETPIDRFDAAPHPSSTAAAGAQALDRDLTAQAFRSLPSRWQEVLWYSEIEQMEPAEIAPLLGSSAGAVSQLSFRAREGMCEAWMHALLRNTDASPECRWAIENLGARPRGALAPRAQQGLDDHLASCARCTIVAAEAQEVSSRLALALLPMVLGADGAEAYLASLHGAPTAIDAFAAMPSSVVEGADVVTHAEDAAHTARPSGSGSRVGSSWPGSVAGVGALVGVGSAALIVAGAVAAAAVVPAMVTATPATSLPSAAEPDSAWITSEVAADESMTADAPMIIEVDDREPDAAPVPKAPAPRVPAPRAPAPKAPVQREPVAPVVDVALKAPLPIVPVPQEPAADSLPNPAPSPTPTETPVPEPTQPPIVTVPPTSPPSSAPTPIPDPDPSENTDAPASADLPQSSEESAE
ncbi:sigma-70 family RNA polymerase sigma factor [Microbacterium sp. NPDC089318]